MKDLYTIFELEGGGGAAPANTLGAGNPACIDGVITDPFAPTLIDNAPTAKTKKEKISTSKTKKKKHMKDLKEQLNESLENIEEARTNGYIEFEVYDRGMSNEHRKAKFFAKDLYDAVKLIVSRVGTYEWSEDWNEEDGEFYLPDDAPKAKRDKVAKEAIARIDDRNGDGCDYIFNFTWNGKTYLEGEDYSEEEW